MIGPSITIAGLLSILWRRKGLMLLSGLAGACLAFAVSRTLPLHYASEGNLIIEHPASAGNDPKSPSVLTAILTQVDVLKSQGLIRRSLHNMADTAGLIPTMRLPAPIADFLSTFPVADYLSTLRDRVARMWRSDESPPSDPDTEKARYIEDHLQVEAKDSSSVISVRFEAGAPDTAAAVVNAIMGTYISTVGAAKESGIAKADQWISQQIAANWQEVEAAEQRVTQFMREHRNLTEVQGGLTASIQLSKDEGQLALAREELARQQASLDTLSNGGGAGAEEILTSKSIQALKELESKTLDQLSTLSAFDPRRAPLQDRLGSVRGQLKTESKLIAASIARSVQIGLARVQALEAAVKKESEAAQGSTEAGTTLKQLTSDLEAKRQLYVAFLTGAGQARLAAVQAPSARVLFQAPPPTRPVTSFGALSLVFGFFAGVVGAAGLIMARSTLGMKINSTDEMARVTGLPIFGALPEFKQSNARNMLVPQTEPRVTETFRGMWLAMRPPQNDGTTILVTSSEMHEGKTTIASALARRFADDGFRVLLVDADLRRPQLARNLNVRPKNYLESVLSGDATVDEAVVYDSKTGLSFLLAKGGTKNPVRSLSSNQFQQLIISSRQAYDFVILDSAPVLHVVDPLLLATLCQYIVFVVEAGRVPGAWVGEAVRRFPEKDRAKMFTLLTRVRSSHLDKRDYYSGYASA